MKKLMIMAAFVAAGLLPQVGKAGSDHLNLWLLLSVENGDVDFIWPLGQYKHSDSWRFFPIIWDYGTFCVFPELWIGPDMFGVLPLVSRYDFSSGCVFPLAWWDFDKTSSFNTIFPLYWYNRYGNGNLTAWAGCGLAGFHQQHGSTDSHWLLPLYAKTRGGSFYSIPYTHRRMGGGGDETLFLAGLAGASRNGQGVSTEHWCFPIYSRYANGFTSLPYSFRRNADGSLKSWKSLLALSGGWQEPDAWNEIYLCGLAGRTEGRGNDFSSSWCVPLYYANTQGTVVTPVYGRTKNAQWGLPGWYKDADTFASPFWYHHLNAQGEMDQWLMPVLMSGSFSRDGVSRTGLFLNAAGWVSDDTGFFSSWCAPLYYADNEGLIITPLYGRNKTSQWCFPLWYNDANALYSPLWCTKKNGDGSLKAWFSPVLLSGCTTRQDGAHEARLLLGLGGAEWGGANGARSSWLFPLYYEDNGGSFVTPIAGRAGKKNWMLPLYWYDREDGDFVSLPYLRFQNDRRTSYVIPPLLSWYTAYEGGADERHALLLYGHKNNAEGKTIYDFLAPLYFYDGTSHDFRSLIYGRNSGSGKTWWMTPLVGTYSGTKSGGWFFPLFHRKADADYGRYGSCLDADCLSQEVMADSFSSKVTGSVLLGSDHDRTVKGYEMSRPAGQTWTKLYQVEETSKRGNKLVFNHTSDRTVFFDRQTGRRVDERMSSETMALGGLFSRTHKADTEAGTSHTRTRVLWKLWDREETDGHVTLDAFPGFSHESRKDGFSKTSFLWRFFRYERKPGEDPSIDLLYIPVWRP